MNKKIINWGIIGTGKSAHNFAQALSITKRGKLMAVASRSQDNAENFARRFDLSFYFSSYKELANSSKIDIVYIATPNSCHKDNAVLCLNAGKNVLIEKPFTTNAKDAEILINLAKKHKLFLMEAMWTRFLPAFDKIDALIKDGEIGEVTAFNASLGQPSIFNKESNIFSEKMGGGAVLDLGVYLVFWSNFLFGMPKKVQNDVHYASNNIDLTSSSILSYSKGKHAYISSSIVNRFSSKGVIYGTKGSIEVQQPLYCPTSFNIVRYSNVLVTHKENSITSALLKKLKNISLFQNLYLNYPIVGSFLFRNKVKKTIHVPIKGNGLQYMAENVSNHLLGCNDKNSNVFPLEETFRIMKTIEKIRYSE